MSNIENKLIEQTNSYARHRGVSMVEVLITLVILAVGLLGVASLQFTALFANKNALVRTQAVLLAEQVVERLRASAVASQINNGYAVHANFFNNDYYNFNNLSCSSSAPPYECHCLHFPAEIPNCYTNNCDAATLAIFSAYQMSCFMLRENPNALISLSCEDTNTSNANVCTAGSIVQVMVKWPSQTWGSGLKLGNSQCNTSDTYTYDCVVKAASL